MLKYIDAMSLVMADGVTPIPTLKGKTIQYKGQYKVKYITRSKFRMHILENLSEV